MHCAGSCLEESFYGLEENLKVPRYLRDEGGRVAVQHQLWPEMDPFLAVEGCGGTEAASMWESLSLWRQKNVWLGVVVREVGCGEGRQSRGLFETVHHGLLGVCERRVGWWMRQWHRRQTRMGLRD